MDTPFRLSDQEPEARLKRLAADQADALEHALEGLGAKGESQAMALFLLPMAEAGFASAQMIRLIGKIPAGYALDHREMFYDFRLDRWIKHIEPPTLAECLEEYVRNAETPEQGLAYARKVWEEFLRRHGAA